MTDIKSCFDPSLRRTISSKKRLAAVIPVGSIEQHGPHLPVSTDCDIVSEVAKRISEKNGYLLLPTLSYGVSFEHAPFFNLSIRKSTLRSMLVDLCLSLRANNIKTVFVINGHHGNLKAVKSLDKKLEVASKNRLEVFSMSYWHYTQREFDHAGFVETSLMLAISKNVKMSQAKKGLITDGMTKQEIAKVGRLANESFPKATKNGVWGDPRKATKKEGQAILAEIVKNLGKKCKTSLNRRD